MKRSTTGRGDAITRVLDLLSSPFARRKFDRELETCELARRVLSFCRYRRAPEPSVTPAPTPAPKSSVSGASAPPSLSSTWPSQ